MTAPSLPYQATPEGRAAVVCGIGAALPPTVVSNADLCTRLNTSDTWIRSRTGITQRRIAGPGTSTCDLAVDAAADALITAQASGIKQVGALVVATTTPDVLCPAGAPAVAARLGLPTIPAVDLAAGCSGFLYALATAAGFIATRLADAVLVVGADRLSVLPDPHDRTTMPLFGDGAGAMVVAAGPAAQTGTLGPLVLGSDGSHADLIRAVTPRSMHMQGTAVFRHAVDRMAAASIEAVRAAGWDLDDVDYLVPHQANARITGFVAQQLGIDPDRQFSNIEHVGNTGAASIPLLLAQACADGRLGPGRRLLLTAFGSGLTWGAATLTWPDLPATHPVSDIEEHVL